MFINYLNDRKQLGYKVVKDTNCAIELVLITESTVLLIRNLPLNVKRKSKKIVFVSTVVFTLIFSNVRSAEAVVMPMPPSPQQELVLPKQSSNSLIRASNVPMSVDTQPKIRLIKMKSDLTDSIWVKEFIVSIRGGADEKLIKSILSKTAESDLDVPSINKILERIADAILSVGSNEKLMKILAEFEKPFNASLLNGPLLPSTDILGFPKADAFVMPTSGLSPSQKRTKLMLQSESSSSSASSRLFFTQGSVNREANDMPRKVIQRFESKAVRKLAKTSLKNQDVKKEYARIQERIEAGINPVNIGKKSTFVSADKVLIKGEEGRYLVEVGETKVDILGFTYRGDTKSIEKFKNLMNELYDVNLQY